jgi:oligopeptide/dipeptide ABC transporter ATP-binding protein
VTELLRVENLRTSFVSGGGSVRVVDGVDLVVHRGTTLGLVGESGSGKSVTAMSVVGLLGDAGRIEPGSRIEFEGHDLANASEREVRAIRGGKIAMIFQEPMTSLNPVMRVGAQVAEVLRLHSDVSRADAHRRAVEVLESVGIAAAARRARDYPHQLSGGMRQRVMIAMALICSPQLLIADEPTTALDITIQAQILNLLRDLRDGSEMSILLITHDLGVVAEMAEEVAVMYAGQVIERGPTADVLHRPQHPYTRALIQSIPALGATHAQRLSAIPGTVPAATDWPVGCRFAARCEFAFDRCLTEAPPAFQVGTQQANCWLHAESGLPEFEPVR